eukprot:Sspe_Gene.36355::Locus_17571_Transcript_1_1_Confidence_1.000_Length_2020::g.36355::m.36355
MGDMPEPNTISVVSDLDGKRYKLVIKGGLRTITVAKMKKHLVGPTGIKAEDQQLSFNGEHLEDHQTGEAIGLVGGSVLRLGVRGAAQAAPPPPMPSMVRDHHQHLQHHHHHQQPHHHPPQQQQPLPPSPSGYPARPSLVPSTSRPAQPPYYTTSESSAGVQSHQVSSSRSSSEAGKPLGHPPPQAHLTADVLSSPGLQLDIRGRERQRTSELSTLQRRAEELDTDRQNHIQAGLLSQPSTPGGRHAPHHPSDRPQGGMQSTPSYTFPSPNPSRVDPSVAGYNDYLAHKERLLIEGQAELESQIEREKQRLGAMTANMQERQERQERMIYGVTKRERDLEDQTRILEQHCEQLRAELQNASQEKARLESLAAETGSKDSVIQSQRNEIDNLRMEVERLRRQPSPSLAPQASPLELARQNLVDFGKELGVEADLDFDENLTCVVGVEQKYTILLTFDQATERLYMYSTLLTYLPKDERLRLALFETLLEGALLGRDMSGGGVGVSLKNELILMATSIDLRHSNRSALKNLAPQFVDSLVKWRQAVKDVLESHALNTGPSHPHITGARSGSGGGDTPHSYHPHPMTSSPSYHKPLTPMPDTERSKLGGPLSSGTWPQNITSQINEQELAIHRQQQFLQQQRNSISQSFHPR